MGIAGSINKGASNAVGEGHGNFLLYDANLDNNLPDYNQLYADVLLKYDGFSFMAEYVNSTAGNLDLVYTDANATQLFQLAPMPCGSWFAIVMGISFLFLIDSIIWSVLSEERSSETMISIFG